MKKPSLLSLLFIIFCLSSCNVQVDPQAAAEGLVQLNLKRVLRDPESYIPGSFTELDTIYSRHEYDEIYINAINEISSYGAYVVTIKKYGRFRSYRKNDIPILQDSIAKYSAIKDSIVNNFKKEIVTFAMRHDYRAKNGFGGYTQGYQEFFIEKHLILIDGYDFYKEDPGLWIDHLDIVDDEYEDNRKEYLIREQK